MIILEQKDDGSYGVRSNIKITDIQNMLQLTSAIGTVNYFAMAAAGTIMDSDDSVESKAAVAGSVAMMFNTSITETKLSNGLNVSLGEGMTVKAESHNNRLLGGAVSISPQRQVSV